MKQYYSSLKCHILPFFNKKYPQSITPFILKKWYSTFTDKSTLTTCVNGILKPAFENAIIEEQIKTSPFIVSFPTFTSNYEMKPFSIDEIKLILDNADGWFKNFLGIAFFTGARTGEILALEWSDIDFKNYTIYINKTRSNGFTKIPKTKSSIREIDIIPQCEFFLKEQFKLSGSGINIFNKENSNKKLYSSSVLYYKWKDLLYKCNLKYRNIYQTRHSFASNMISNRENIFWVTQMLGHKNMSITLDRYSKYIRNIKERKTTFLDNNSFLIVQN